MPLALLDASTKHLTQGERVCSSSQLGVQSIVEGKVWWPEVEVVVHGHSEKRQKGMDAEASSRLPSSSMLWLALF